MEEKLSTEDVKEEVQVEKVGEPIKEETDGQSVQAADQVPYEPAPEGVPTLTLHRQYEQETKEIRTDVETPREMNGQTVYFDEDHHPIMDHSDNDSSIEQLSLFAPDEYNLWTQEVNRSEEHTSELQSRQYLVCRLLLEKK